MCGVFGFVSHDDSGPDLKVLSKIARVTERRGPHAFGFAWLDSRGVLKMFKQTGRISDHLGLLAMAKDARMLIGHCRFATQGDPANNLNNHPHACDGGWIIHNGMIHEYTNLIADYDLHPVTSCDSETLGLLIEDFQGTLTERCIAAARLVDSPLVLCGLWSRPAQLVIVKKGNPLSIGMSEKGDHYYFASLPEGLPGEVVAPKQNTAIRFTKTRAKRMGFSEMERTIS